MRPLAASAAAPEQDVEQGAAQDPVEARRLAAVRRYNVLDTPPDGAFDRVTSLAARLFDVPISVVSIVDEDRIWFKSRHGLDARELPRDPGLCASAILHGEPWIVSDAKNDPRTLTNPLVASDFGLRFYAGAPLATSDGHNLGVLAVLDFKPRAPAEAEIAALRDLAAIVVDELELRLAANALLAETRKNAELTSAAAVAEALVITLAAHDAYTADHSREVVALSGAVARELGLSADEIRDVEQVALLHDLGKLMIPRSLLHKQGRLDKSELTILRGHPAAGAAIVESIPEIAHIAPSILAEHERWDGTGYPRGLAGEDIPIASRITLLCDAYQAMISDRPYRKALMHADALRELKRGSGGQFCPTTVLALLAVLVARDRDADSAP
jgi:GAF domain-containing protein